jgi:hypothetical protein
MTLCGFSKTNILKTISMIAFVETKIKCVIYNNKEEREAKILTEG